jgi:hypothetical protein
VAEADTLIGTSFPELGAPGEAVDEDATVAILVAPPPDSVVAATTAATPITKTPVPPRTSMDFFCSRRGPLGPGSGPLPEPPAGAENHWLRRREPRPASAGAVTAGCGGMVAGALVAQAEGDLSPAETGFSICAELANACTGRVSEDPSAVDGASESPAWPASSASNAGPDCDSVISPSTTGE